MDKKSSALNTLNTLACMAGALGALPGGTMKPRYEWNPGEEIQCPDHLRLAKAAAVRLRRCIRNLGPACESRQDLEARLTNIRAAIKGWEMMGGAAWRQREKEKMG